jgi:hypothetical protein
MPRWSEHSSGHSEDSPSCLRDDSVEAPCPECPFWDAISCPIASDPEYRSYYDWDHERRREYESQRAEQIDTLTRILIAHGLPLHYEVITAMAREQRPDLFQTPRSVLQLMSWRPRIFEALGAGVYRLFEN